MQTVARDAVLARPSNIDELIAIIQQEFPRAGIRITGRARTIRRQAELMADSREPPGVPENLPPCLAHC